MPVLPAQAALRVAAVVVTFNRLDKLSVTVGRLLDQPVDHLVVVDNASTDGTQAWLDAIDDPRLYVIRTSENLGGAGGFECGLRATVERFDPDWCLVMDDDSRPAPAALERFRALAGSQHAEGWDAIAAAVYFPDGSICEMNRPARNPFWSMRHFLRTAAGKGRAGFHLPDSAYDESRLVPVDAASFVGLFLSRAAIARAGFPDGSLFIYGDDLIYTLELRRAGGKIAFAPELEFEHDSATYSVERPFRHQAVWKIYYNYRNALLAYRLAAGPVFFWPVLAVVTLRWLMRSSIYGSGRRAYLALFRLALVDALRGQRARPQGEIIALADGRS
ncbi:glycosyltransferase [Rhodobacteraceae bacterium WD3A24]|nr:glycosyltransferase [Rhodobacteraceae bacterium WD3A24]